MYAPLHTVVETARFLKDAAAAGISEEERKAIVDVIASAPGQGNEVQGTGGVRKVRIAGRGKGKSGGYRLMVAYLGRDAPAYLLAVLSKGDRSTFNMAEIASMRRVTTSIKQAWRKG